MTSTMTTLEHTDAGHVIEACGEEYASIIRRMAHAFIVKHREPTYDDAKNALSCASRYAWLRESGLSAVDARDNVCSSEFFLKKLFPQTFGDYYGDVMLRSRIRTEERVYALENNGRGHEAAVLLHCAGMPV